MKFFRLGIVILTSFVFSCVQITESPIEGENWSRSGSHLGAPWKIEKKGQALKVKIKDSKISLYPDLIINGVIIKNCGISSVGPSSTDFDFKIYGSWSKQP